jgi:diaminopimelate decarboxylase
MTEKLTVQGLTFDDLADRYGTPCYVYDGDRMRRQYETLRELLHPAVRIFYSLKANPNVSVFGLLHSLGAGAEVSSAVELATALRAGAHPDDILFLGPGKTAAELSSCVEQQIGAVVCESLGELAALNRLAGAGGTTVRVALRINPRFSVRGSGLTMGGKPRQFGIDEEVLLAEGNLPARFPNLRIVGTHTYLGTRILSEDVVVENTTRILDLADRVAAGQGFTPDLVDIGGGFGVAYFDGERDLDVELLCARLNPVIARYAESHPDTRLVLELGRYLVAHAGVYVTRVLYTKESMGERFAVTDGGTNHHMAAVGIGSFVKRNFPIRVLGRETESVAAQPWNVTGPLCTPNDTLGRNVSLPPVRPGDLIGVLRSGAYGPTASPVLFLSHGYPAEVLVDGGRPYLIRDRDQVADLLRPQHLHDLRRAPVPTPQ